MQGVMVVHYAARVFCEAGEGQDFEGSGVRK